MKTLSADEISELYEKEPELADPDFPKEVLNKVGEVITFLIDVLGVEYICVSDPNKEDIWYL